MTDMKLIMSIINFLKDESQKENLSADTKESLEVAVQCLQTAYDLKPNDPSLSHLQTSRTLAEIFHDAIGNNVTLVTPQKPSEEAQLEAEKMKNLGNSLMKSEKYQEALSAYSNAIELDGSNAVYYCNRAAAYSRLSDYHAAIQDCQHAISIDAKYSKAFGRMGLAYASLNRHEKAIECYKKAVELDPTNDSYRTNLKTAEERGNKFDNPAGQIPNLANSPLDFTTLLNNPMLRNMATTMMQDPGLVNLMSGFMSSSLNESGEGGGMDALVQVGQRLAAEMQASNPALTEQLRQQFFPGGQNAQNPDNKDPSSN